MHSNRPQSSARSHGAAKSLLLQHQQLLGLILDMEEQLNAVRGEADFHECKRAMDGLLQKLRPALVDHFQTERESLERDFSDVPHLRAELQKLDQEHPQLLERFQRAAQELRGDAPPRTVCHHVERAIFAFRDHEAREDALFASE